ncbi:hypothetical protein C5C00_08880 [Rathayibacter rathayi]|nr:hypothetical protein C5C47_07405 [Rathayibacter rathayi]PPG96242.1 hypothetical protein C5C00_08880 [Rathayibacter rathayi]
MHAVAVDQADLDPAAAQSAQRRGQVGVQSRVVQPEHQARGAGLAAGDRLERHMHALQPVAVSGHRHDDLAVRIDCGAAREAVGERERQQLDADGGRGVVDRPGGDRGGASRHETPRDGVEDLGHPAQARAGADPTAQRCHTRAGADAPADGGESGMHQSRVVGAP